MKKALLWGGIGWVGGACCGPMGLFDDTSSECIGELYLQLFPLSDVKHNTIILYWSSWACGPTARAAGID